MPTARTGDGGAFAPWCLAGSAATLWFHLGLLLNDSVFMLVNAQSECDSGMCERPQSTLSKQTTAQDACYNASRQIIVHCNPGFRLSGENYTASCSDGVWTPDNGCRIDLFTVFVAASACMVSILIFFICFLCIYTRGCTPRKRKQHTVSRVKKGKKKRARAPADPEAANRPAEEPDEFEDDFTDEEEEEEGARATDTRRDENIYQNLSVQCLVAMST